MEYLIALTFLLAPAYAVRFSLGSLPTNILMVGIMLVWVIFLGWLVYRRAVGEFLRSIIALPPLFLIFTALFFLSGTLALFVDGISQPKIGQYIVWFFQPVSMFFIARFIKHKRPEVVKRSIQVLYGLLLVSGIYAAIQYFTRLGLPPAWWGNSLEPKRAISFFEHPNAFALFVTPVMAFLLPEVLERARGWKMSKNWFYIVSWLVGGMGLLLSLSRGAWMGLGAAVIVLLLIAADKKYFKLAAVTTSIALVIILVVPNFRWRLLLPFRGERSASARVILWRTGWNMVKDSPVAGKGLLGASNNWNRYALDPSLGHYPFPHNIFLDLWIDTGLLGLISFLLLSGYGLWHSWRNRKNVYAFGLGLFLIALIVHGFVDNPYFKNDLALVFWLIWALVM